MRQSLREPEDGLRLPRRFERGDERLFRATRSGPVRCELGRSSRRVARELVGKQRVQLLALTGQDRRVDRLRQERVAEAEAAGRLIGDEDSVLDRLPQRPAHLALRKVRHLTEQRVRHVASGGGRHAQHALCRRVQPDHALQQQFPHDPGELAALVAGGGKELLGKEGVAVGAKDDRVPQRCRQGRVGAGDDQRRQLGVVERPELEHGARARVANAVAQSKHALGRRGLVITVRPEQQYPPVVEVVREEDDKVEGRGIGPVQILEHEQHGYGGCSLGEEGERLLEHLQLRARLRTIDPARISQGTKGLGERLIRKLRADEVDRASEEDVEARVAGNSRELGGEPCLADARFAGG